MKKILTLAAMAMLTLSVWAENIQTLVLTPSPAMSCQNCEKKIKTNIRFVKGTKSIETSIDNNTVTIKYDADKASLADYEKAFSKIGREVQVLTPEGSDQTAKPACKDCGNSCH